VARVFNYIISLVNIEKVRESKGVKKGVKRHPHALDELKFHTCLITYQKKKGS